MKKHFLPVILLSFTSALVSAQAKHEDTEFYTPVPPVVTPAAANFAAPPKDAVVLFDGKSLDNWVTTNDTTKAATWDVAGGVMTVNKTGGNIQTKQSFQDYQLHIEWKIPTNITGTSQARGNSGLFLASIGKGDAGYELQIMDSYNNPTYVNGQAGSIYKQFAPLVNPNLPPGQWQSYDVAWKAPRFNQDGTLQSPARVTVYFNGILVQNNVELKGPTLYVGQPSYKAHNAANPVKLQAHGDKSEPISFRNIWIRPA
ncbi:MAG: 3-keto-disaccharide hydrolase [Segetibacter sp.]